MPRPRRSPLLGWLIGECRRFCEQTGRCDLSQADQDALIEAFVQADGDSIQADLQLEINRIDLRS